MREYAKSQLEKFRNQQDRETLDGWRKSMPSQVHDISSKFNLTVLDAMLKAIKHPDKQLVEDLRQGMSIKGHVPSANLFSGKPPLKPKEYTRQPLVATRVPTP